MQIDVTDSTLPHYHYDRYHAGGPMSIRGFGGYGIGPRAPPSAPSSTELAQDVITGDALGGFAKSTFLGTLSVPINLKVVHCCIVAFLWL